MISSMNKYDIYCMSFSFSINDRGGGEFGSIFAGFVPQATLAKPLPQSSLFCGQL